MPINKQFLFSSLRFVAGRRSISRQQVAINRWLTFLLLWSCGCVRLAGWPSCLAVPCAFAFQISLLDSQSKFEALPAGFYIFGQRTFYWPICVCFHRVSAIGMPAALLEFQRSGGDINLRSGGKFHKACIIG